MQRKRINEMRLVTWNVHQKTDGGIVYKKIIDVKQRTRKRGKKIEMTGRSPLRSERSHWTAEPFKKKKKKTRWR
jgi:hypothetical protein